MMFGERSGVSTEPSPTAKAWEDFFRDVNRLTSTAVAYWSVMVVNAGVLIFLWSRGKADHPMYGLLVAICTGLLGPGMAIPVMLRLPPRWFRVPPGERVLHRILGVGVFGWLLERSGYNRRVVHPMWGFSINRAGLPFRAQAALGGASAHGAGFVIHIVLAALALFTGYSWRALWILLPGVVFISTRCCYSARSCFDSSLCWISPAGPRRRVEQIQLGCKQIDELRRIGR
jgi:hypothetical protein